MNLVIFIIESLSLLKGYGMIFYQGIRFQLRKLDKLKEIFTSPTSPFDIMLSFYV